MKIAKVQKLIFKSLGMTSTQQRMHFTLEGHVLSPAKQIPTDHSQILSAHIKKK